MDVRPSDDAMTMSRGRVEAIRVVRDLDERSWRSFVDDHPRGNVFHTPEMFRVFERAQGHRPEVWAVVDDRSKVHALATPVHIALRPGFLQRFTARSVAYGSVLCRAGEEGRTALRMLLTAYNDAVEGRSLFTELRNLGDVSDLQPLLQSCGYVYEDHLNFLVALDLPIEEMRGLIGRRTRKAIGRVLRHDDVSIAEVRDPQDLTIWYGILHQTYRNARIPLAHLSLFEAALEVLVPLGMARFLLVRVDGTPVGCSAELAYKDTIYGWYGGSDRTYGRYIPNDLLVWHILEWGSRNGYRVYDFGGAGTPDEEYGVRDFKAKFGGQLVSFGRFTHVHAPLRLRLSTAGYQLLRRFL